MLDKDGYPTERSLVFIAEYDCSNGIDNLMQFVEDMWHFGDWGYSRKEDSWELHTGGWSGNEDIIGALADNRVFWMLYWEQSRRGGHYLFDLSRYKKGE